jgi:6-pyruvoyltetrahydropterin/6-carboxytetrahydropterin synthase
MNRLATLHINKQAHKFSAAHFTIFSATERERLHGHNYGVSARIVAEMGENGFSADYNVYKRCLQKLCDAHDEYLLLPAQSPWLDVIEEGDEYFATFNGKTLRFPCDETLLLPIVNVTVEALAHYLLDQILEEDLMGDVVELEVFVTSGDGQASSACWAPKKNEN